MNSIRRRTGLMTSLLLVITLLVLSACSSAPGGSSQPGTTPQESPAPQAEKPGIDTSRHAIFYPDFWKMSELGPTIPGLQEDMVPQGLAYWQEKDWLITSNYRDSGAPSTLMVIDRKSGGLVKQVTLTNENGSPYLGHAGGLTVSPKHLWITSGSRAFWIPLTELATVADKGSLKFGGNILTVTRGSFGTYADGILWVGDFHLLPDYPTDPSHRMVNNEKLQHNAWIAGYLLDPATDQLPTDRTNGTNPVSPDYILSVTDKVQGVAFTPAHVILSLSYGRANDSTLLKYDRPDLASAPHTTTPVGERQVPVWFLDGLNLSPQMGKLPLPPMAEGIVAVDNQLYVLYESGAKKFRGANAPMDRISVLSLDEWSKAEAQK